MLTLIMKSDIKGTQIWTGSACKWVLLEYHSPDLPLSEWDETQSPETSVRQHFWQLNPACGGRPVNLKSKFGDISYFFFFFFFPNTLRLLPNNLFPFAFITDSPTNKRLRSGRFVTLIQGRNLWTALSTSLAAYSRYCLSLRSRKTESKGRQRGRERSGSRSGVEREGQMWTANERRKTENEERRGEERKGVGQSDGGRGGNHSIVSAEGKRYEYSNFTLLIRDGCLFLWGTALLVFVSSLIICMMYSTALYSVMGERWRSGRLTMRPKGRRGRHSQLYSMQRSKATFLYPKLVTISQPLKLPSNNSTYLRSAWTRLFWGEITVLGQESITNHESALPKTQGASPDYSFWMTQDGLLISPPRPCSWTLWTTSPISGQSCAGAGIPNPVNHIISAGATSEFQNGQSATWSVIVLPCRLIRVKCSAEMSVQHRWHTFMSIIDASIHRTLQGCTGKGRASILDRNLEIISVFKLGSIMSRNKVYVNIYFDLMSMCLDHHLFMLIYNANL